MGWVVLIDHGRWVAGYLSWWKKRASKWRLTCDSWIRFERAELLLAHSHTKTSGFTTPWPRIFLLTSISSSTMCTQPSDPFVEPFYNLNKAFTRLLSPIPESADESSLNFSHLSSAPSTFTTPSSTILAADIAMPVTSKILSNLPDQNWTSIAHRIKFAGDKVQVPQEGVVERSQEVLPISTGPH